MGQFLKLTGAKRVDFGVLSQGKGGSLTIGGPIWVNIDLIDEVFAVAQSVNGQKTLHTHIYVHHETPHQQIKPSSLSYAQESYTLDRTSHYEVAETAESVVKRIEDLRAADIASHHAPPAAAPEPEKLGYAFAASNKNILSVALSNEIDDYDEIEFAGRAAGTPAAALLAPSPFSLRVKVSAIPINKNPIAVPHHVLAVPGVDNINVSRSTDGQTVHLIGQDDAAAFGITVLGHEAE